MGVAAPQLCFAHVRIRVLHAHRNRKGLDQRGESHVRLHVVELAVVVQNLSPSKKQRPEQPPEYRFPLWK
jgi:hypothetical protein